MENATNTPALELSTPVETPVEKIIRETLNTEVTKATGTANKYFSGQIHALNYSSIAKTIAAALIEAGHVCPHTNFTNAGQCDVCGRDMIPELRAMPGTTDVEKALIEAMANTEPEPKPIFRHVGRVAYRRIQTLETRRRVVAEKIRAARPEPTNFERAEYAALTFAIGHIQDHYQGGAR